MSHSAGSDYAIITSPTSCHDTHIATINVYVQTRVDPLLLGPHALYPSVWRLPVPRSFLFHNSRVRIIAQGEGCWLFSYRRFREYLKNSSFLLSLSKGYRFHKPPDYRYNTMCMRKPRHIYQPETQMILSIPHDVLINNLKSHEITQMEFDPQELPKFPFNEQTTLPPPYQESSPLYRGTDSMVEKIRDYHTEKDLGVLPLPVSTPTGRNKKRTFQGHVSLFVLIFALLLISLFVHKSGLSFPDQLQQVAGDQD